MTLTTTRTKTFFLAFAFLGTSAIDAGACKVAAQTVTMKAPDRDFTMETLPGWSVSYTADSAIFDQLSQGENGCEDAGTTVTVTSFQGHNAISEVIDAKGTKRAGFDISQYVLKHTHPAVKTADGHNVSIAEYESNNSTGRFALAKIRLAGPSPYHDNFIIMVLSTKDVKAFPSGLENFKTLISSFNEL